MYESPSEISNIFGRLRIESLLPLTLCFFYAYGLYMSRACIFIQSYFSVLCFHHAAVFSLPAAAWLDNNEQNGTQLSPLGLMNRSQSVASFPLISSHHTLLAVWFLWCLHCHAAHFHSASPNTPDFIDSSSICLTKWMILLQCLSVSELGWDSEHNICTLEFKSWVYVAVWLQKTFWCIKNKAYITKCNWCLRREP